VSTVLLVGSMLGFCSHSPSCISAALFLARGRRRHHWGRPSDAMWRFVVVAAITHIMCWALISARLDLFCFGGRDRHRDPVPGLACGKGDTGRGEQANPSVMSHPWIPRSFKMWLSALLDTASSTGSRGDGFFLGQPRWFLLRHYAHYNVFAIFPPPSACTRHRGSAHFSYAESQGRASGDAALVGDDSVALVAVALIIILVAGKLLLWLFGAAYVSAYPELLAMAAGAANGRARRACCSSPVVDRHEGTYPRIWHPESILRFVLIAFLGPLLGLMGAVIAWAVSTIAISLALVAASCRLVGLTLGALGIPPDRANDSRLKGAYRDAGLRNLRSRALAR